MTARLLLVLAASRKAARNNCLYARNACCSLQRRRKAPAICRENLSLRSTRRYVMTCFAQHPGIVEVGCMAHARRYFKGGDADGGDLMPAGIGGHRAAVRDRAGGQRQASRRARTTAAAAGAGAADSRELFRIVQRLVFDLRAMGRRHPRPRRCPQRTGYCAVGKPELADRPRALRSLPHVRLSQARHARAGIDDSPRFLHDRVAFGVNVTA